MEKRKSRLMGQILVYLFLGVLTIFTLYPILYVVLGSFKENQELVLGGTSMLPETFQISNYIEAWRLADFGRYTFNSVFLSTMVTAGVVAISSMAGYCFARREFPGKNLLYSLMIAFMFINIGSISLRPLFELAVKLKMNRSMWSVILICIGTNQVTNIFLVRGYMATVPRELDEAAAIDGCSFFQIYYKIILPVLKPVLATVALLSFRSAWNEFIMPQVFTMSNPKMRPLTVGVVALKTMGDGAAAWNIMFAGSAMSIVPIVIVYLFTSRYFMSGLTVGAVKG
ncbi:MAG: carbohydrate ABC transporter permease [Lachnospiraceae bacterium]|jgi:ABC-type glycerol-3-phosphate transport system permease component|nr:carbohydrate ABC transporter permease [Lachnospiraceae bacterium]MCI9590593.1 carbohydrate ABC transporter permease [Lachnospiraceae bacterium]